MNQMASQPEHDLAASHRGANAGAHEARGTTIASVTKDATSAVEMTLVTGEAVQSHLRLWAARQGPQWIAQSPNDFVEQEINEQNAKEVS